MSRRTRPAARRPARRSARVHTRLGRPHIRLHVALAALGVLLSALALRLVQLQGFDSTAYAKQAERQRLHTITLTADRGAILDRNGQALALTIDARLVYADPVNVDNPDDEAATLAPILHRPVTELARLMRLPHTRFAVLAHGVDPAVGRQIENLALPGIGTVHEARRIYPNGALAANLIGFAPNGPGTGAGLELAENSLLSGRDGQLTAELSVSGRMIPDGTHTDVPAVPGSTLQLTIDRDLQWEAQQALSAQVAATGAASGTVIVMNPQTGELLAMATTPTFDPNDPGKAAPNALGDPAVSDVYEPGSVNKVITVAAALQDGLVTPDTPMTVPPYLRIAGRVFQDAEPHGTEQLTVTGVLAKSSNIGAIEIEQKLGAARFYNYLRSFGFGQSTGVGLPGESPGILPPSNLWNGSQQYTIAFGQGISVTALQVASVYATVANHGLRVVPTIVRGTIGPDGRLRPLARPGPRQVITASVAKQVANMLEAVTSDEGTAPKARIAGYRVAGKTGTAMRVDPTCGCYRGYTATFVGFAPADNPRLLVEVVLQNPQRGHFGGAVAAPVFHQVMAFALESLRIPPTGTPPPVARLTPG